MATALAHQLGAAVEHLSDQILPLLQAARVETIANFRVRPIALGAIVSHDEPM